MERTKKIFIAILVLAVVGIAGFYMYKKSKTNNNTSTTSNTNNSEQPSTSNPVTTPPSTNPAFPDHGMTDMGGDRVNCIFHAINTADSAVRTWEVTKNGSVILSNQLQTGQTWEVKGLPTGTYLFRVLSPSALGGYFVAVTVIGGYTVNEGGINEAKSVQFTIP